MSCAKCWIPPITDYIGFYENIIPNSVCDDIIENDNECIITVEITNGFIPPFGENSVEILLNNPIGIAGFQFEIEDIPNVLRNVDVIPTERTASFSIFSNENDGVLYIAGFHPELDIITPGSGSILEVIYEVGDVEPDLEIVLDLFNSFIFLSI